MIPSTLFRYLMRSYLERFGLVLLLVVMGLLLSNTFDTLNRFRSTTFTLPIFINLVSLKLPYLLIEIMPMTGFIATLFFLYYLSRTNQLVSIWSTGASTWNVLFPVVISGILIGVITTIMLQPVASMLIGKYDTMEAKLLKRRSDQVTLSNSGIMIAEDYDNERRVIVARSVDAQANKLYGITILLIDGDNNFISRFDASSASMDQGQFTLHNVKVFEAGDDSNIPRSEESKSFETKISIDRFSKGMVSPEHISFWRLPQLIEKLHKAGIPTSRYQVYYYKQLLKPIMMTTVCFMAFCFITPRQSRVRDMRAFAFGIFIGFVVYLMSEICVVVLMRQGFDAILASLCPMLVIILLSIFAILHLHETG